MSLKNVVSLPEYKSVLPSGLNVRYRPFVVKEEKILLMAKESKDFEHIYSCIKNVIKNCVIEPENIDVDKLSYFDVQQLFIYLRCKSMGESVQIRVTDPDTKQTFETELDLEKLGFQKIVISPEESGSPQGFYYYEYPLSEDNENLVLVSEDSDEIQDGFWIVQLLDTADYTFTEREIGRAHV